MSPARGSFFTTVLRSEALDISRVCDKALLSKHSRTFHMLQYAEGIIIVSISMRQTVVTLSRPKIYPSVSLNEPGGITAEGFGKA